MKERIINVETGLLAKEKGFDWKCLFYAFENFNAGLDYIVIDELVTQFGQVDQSENHNLKDLYYIPRVSLPTQQFLQKWLREVHGINVVIAPEFACYNILYISKYDKSSDENQDFDLSGLQFKDFTTYEEALETGLLIALKSIEL